MKVERDNAKEVMHLLQYLTIFFMSNGLRDKPDHKRAVYHKPELFRSSSGRGTLMTSGDVESNPGPASPAR